MTASTEPIARVFIDGHDTGKMTPVPPQSAIPLSVGNHTIAFVVGDQTFSYRIKVTAGQRINLVKTLRLP